MPLYNSNFKSFRNKISRIFWFEQLYVWPLLAILKGQYRPCAKLGRLVQGWYGWISALWCHRKLPYAEHEIPGLHKQIMATLLYMVWQAFLLKIAGLNANSAQEVPGPVPLHKVLYCSRYSPSYVNRLPLWRKPTRKPHFSIIYLLSISKSGYLQKA